MNFLTGAKRQDGGHDGNWGRLWLMSPWLGEGNGFGTGLETHMSS